MSRQQRVFDLTAADADRVIALNNRCVPAVTELDRAGYLNLLSQCRVMKGIEEEEEGSGSGGSAGEAALVALLFVGREGMDYASPNYRWVADRYDRFLYVDRVIVASNRRSSGAGSRLYESLFELADEESLPVLAEVNSDPPNPRSLAFHERNGFRVVGSHTHRPGYSVDFVCREPKG